MRYSHKYVFLAAICWLSTAPSVWPIPANAQTAPKQTPARSVPVKKLFQFYDIYLGLPADGRDGFRLDYGIIGGAGAARPQMAYVLGNVRTPVEFAPTGRILNLPDLNMLNNGRIDIAANQPRSGISLNLEPIIPLSRSISVASATNPITDYAAAMRRAGPLAAFAPKLKAIKFKGGSGGEAIFTDGRRTALPIVGGAAVFEPSRPALRGAVSLSFATPPTDAGFSQ